MFTLSTKDNVNLTKQSSDGFKRSVYWKNDQTVSEKVINPGYNIYELLAASFQCLIRLFVFAHVIPSYAGNYESCINDNKKCFLPRGQVLTGRGDDYTTGYLLDYASFKDNFRLIVVHLSIEKASDADPRKIQQIVIQRVVGGSDETKTRL